MSPASPNESKPTPTIEELELTLSELRSAVKASNPLLKAVASSSLYSALSLVFGAVLVVALLVTRSALTNPTFGGFGVWSWIFFIVVLAAGGVVKVIASAKLAAKHGNRGFYSLMASIFGGKASSLIASSAVAIAGGIVFLVSVHRAWYIVPISAIYTGIASHAMDLLIDLPEYRVLGWVSLLSGIVSLFFIQADPLLWTAIVAASVFIIFGAVGLSYAAARKAGRRR
jgi:hypothetical protein